VVECLPRKCEDLSSNPGTLIKKTNKQTYTLKTNTEIQTWWALL
jgi:hypothetical protein